MLYGIKLIANIANIVRMNEGAFVFTVKFSGRQAVSG